MARFHGGAGVGADETTLAISFMGKGKLSSILLLYSRSKKILQLIFNYDFLYLGFILLLTL